MEPIPSRTCFKEIELVKPFECIACSGKLSNRIVTAEKMFGLNDSFVYDCCTTCGTLRIVDPPTDLSRYYPSHYYSFNQPCKNEFSARSNIRKWLFEARISAKLWRKPRWAKLLSLLRPVSIYGDLKYLHSVEGISLHSQVLDVGCGNGYLIREMFEAGFRNLRVVDPFNQGEIRIGNSVLITPTTTELLPNASFDLVMLHHVLEHFADPAIALQEVLRLLADKGTCIVRIPLADSDPFHEYRENWGEFDAPRHFTLFSRSGFESLCKRIGLKCIREEFDGTAVAYWLSEMYRRGICFVDPKTNRFRTPESTFTTLELKTYSDRAAAMNKSGKSGRGVFYLTAE